ncbi:uncharacterized protein ARMOST_06068 [Armillaria ostoyae]|uniref:Uncharacterized protein n=1 Tax=Armillaria ostoyae TaxID=47428 RepID=A0A284R230_ARMOS|nr:uncharacterized protein ARMOST_06068 [Armillaria ostoyae]
MMRGYIRPKYDQYRSLSYDSPQNWFSSSSILPVSNTVSSFGTALPHHTTLIFVSIHGLVASLAFGFWILNTKMAVARLRTTESSHCTTGKGAWPADRMVVTASLAITTEGMLHSYRSNPARPGFRMRSEIPVFYDVYNFLAPIRYLEECGSALLDTVETFAARLIFEER